jgi:serine O-acetyltransferase
VVVKEVPAEATVVGVPGRTVTRTPSEPKQVHTEIARKLGFDAYGTTQDMPDPEAHAINHMIDHIHMTDRKLKELCRVLQAAGIEPGELRIPELVSCEISSTCYGEVEESVHKAAGNSISSKL